MKNKDTRLIPELFIGLALITLVFVIYWRMSPKYISESSTSIDTYASVTHAAEYTHLYGNFYYRITGLSFFGIDRGEIVVYKPRRIRCLEVECGKRVVGKFFFL